MVRQSSILERIIEPSAGGFSSELAKYILGLDFSPEEQARCQALSAKAQAGTLTAEEQADLDELLGVNSLLMILQSKARISLGKHSSAA
jgi:hypothetical protein